MSYVYRADGVNELLIELNNASGAVYSGLETVSSSAMEIMSRSDWEGNKATAVKSYISTVHGTIISSIALLMKDLYDQALLYQKGYKAIDSATHAVISSYELDELQARLKQMAPVFDSLDQEAQQIIRSIAHIGSIPYACIDHLPRSMNELADKLILLDSDINSHEGAFQGRFSAETQLIANVNAMISEARSMKLDAYSAKALAKSKTYQNLVASYQTLQAAVAANADEVREAEALFDETYKVLTEEYQERIATAQRAKFWTALLTATASAVILTVTGGTGVVLVGTISGAVNAAVGSYYDQQIGSVGYVGKTDWGKFALDTTVGGLIGGTTSLITFGFGEVANDFSTIGQIGWKGMESVSVGMVERGGNTFYASLSSGKSFSDSMSDTFSAMYDPNKMIGDFAGGTTGKAFDIGFNKVSDKLEGKIFGNQSGIPTYQNAIQTQKTKSPYFHQVYNVASETGKETAKGVVKRFAGTYAETRDLEQSWEKASDSKAILTDAATTASTATATTVTADIKTKMASKIKQEQKKIDQVQDLVDEDTRKYNNGSKNGKGGNAAICDELGIPRNELGTPEYKGTKHMAARTEIEQVVADPTKVKNTKAAASNQDFKNAYNQMVAEKSIDPNEYIWDDGNVIRKQTVIENGKMTVVETPHTIHHLRYNVNTGKGIFELVDSEFHNGIRHQGAAQQADSAYNKYNVGEYIESYNNAVTEANDLAKDSYDTTKYANQGGKSGKTVSTTPDEEADNSSLPSFDWGAFSLPQLGG